MAAGAARVAAQRIAHDANRRQPRLDDFHRVVPGRGAREDDHRRLAVEGRSGAGAARVQIALDEELARLRVRAERDRGHLVAVRPRGHAGGHRGRQRAQPQIEQQIDRNVVTRRRRRLLGGQHRARRDDDGERAEAALVDRVERRRQALDQHPAGADRDRVPAVEGSFDLRVRARKVDRHAAVADGDRHLDAHGPLERDAVVVEVADRAVHARGDPGERRARAALGLRHVDARRLQHRLAPVLVEHLAEELIARAAHREHRLDVLQGAALGADIAGDDPHHLFVQLAAVHEPHGAKAQTFLPEVGRPNLHRARHGPPDIAPMGLHRREAREPPLPEHGRGHRHVVQVVAIARVGVVVDEDIALAERLEAAIGDRRLNGEP